MGMHIDTYHYIESKLHYVRQFRKQFDRLYMYTPIR